MNSVRHRVARELLPPSPARRSPWSAMLARRRLPSVDAALPEALEAMARSLRSGASLPIAIDEASAAVGPPLVDGLAGVTATAARGLSVADAIDAWAADTKGDGVALAAAALALGAELGGTAARSLDGVADTLRDRNAVHREIRALSTQARASAAVIAVAPIAFSLLVALADPSSVTFLVTSTFGLVCLALGGGLDVVGAWWMRRIVARAGRERDPVAAETADTIDLFVLALGAGLNLRLAVSAVGRRAPVEWAAALQAAAERVDRGQRVSDALEAIPDVLGPAARPVVRALTGAERYGTPLLPTLERLALDARLDRRRRAEEAARRVPVKLLFPLVLCVLPACGLLTVAPLLAGAVDALRL